MENLLFSSNFLEGAIEEFWKREIDWFPISLCFAYKGVFRIISKIGNTGNEYNFCNSIRLSRNNEKYSVRLFTKYRATCFHLRNPVSIILPIVMWYSHSPATDESIATMRDGAVYQLTRNKERIKSNLVARESGRWWVDNEAHYTWSLSWTINLYCLNFPFSHEPK